MAAATGVDGLAAAAPLAGDASLSAAASSAPLDADFFAAGVDVVAGAFCSSAADVVAALAAASSFVLSLLDWSACLAAAFWPAAPASGPLVGAALEAGVGLAAAVVPPFALGLEVAPLCAFELGLVPVAFAVVCLVAIAAIGVEAARRILEVPVFAATPVADARCAGDGWAGDDWAGDDWVGGVGVFVGADALALSRLANGCDSLSWSVVDGCRRDDEASEAALGTSGVILGTLGTGGTPKAT